MFYIIEQGTRIHTPVDQLLQAKGVPEVSATSKVHPVGPHSDEASQRGAKTAVPLYQDDEQELPRDPVTYAYQIMTSPVVSAHIDQSLNDIWALFSKLGFHHLPLINDQQKMQGIVSDRDLLRFAANNNREVGSYRIGQLMTRRVISAAEQTEIRTIAEVMCTRSIGAVPVVNDAVEVMGIVSRSDILRTLVHRAPLELWA